MRPVGHWHLLGAETLRPTLFQLPSIIVGFSHWDTFDAWRTERDWATVAARRSIGFGESSLSSSPEVKHCTVSIHESAARKSPALTLTLMAVNVVRWSP
jgi:hypothetical protein